MSNSSSSNPLFGEEIINQVCCNIFNRLLVTLNCLSGPIKELHELSDGVILVEIIECYEDVVFRNQKDQQLSRISGETNLLFVERWLHHEGIQLDTKQSIHDIFNEIQKSNHQLKRFMSDFRSEENQSQISSVIQQQQSAVYGRSIAYIAALCYAIFSIFLKNVERFEKTVPGFHFKVGVDELLHILFFTKWKLTEEEVLLKDLEIMKLKDMLDVAGLQGQRLSPLSGSKNDELDSGQKYLQSEQPSPNIGQKKHQSNAGSQTGNTKQMTTVNITSSRTVKDTQRVNSSLEIDSISSMTISLPETRSIGTMTDLAGLENEIFIKIRFPITGSNPKTGAEIRNSRPETLNVNSEQVHFRPETMQNTQDPRLSQNVNSKNTERKGSLTGSYTSSLSNSSTNPPPKPPLKKFTSSSDLSQRELYENVRFSRLPGSKNFEPRPYLIQNGNVTKEQQNIPANSGVQNQHQPEIHTHNQHGQQTQKQGQPERFGQTVNYQVNPGYEAVPKKIQDHEKETSFSHHHGAVHRVPSNGSFKHEHSNSLPARGSFDSGSSISKHSKPPESSSSSSKQPLQNQPKKPLSATLSSSSSKSSSSTLTKNSSVPNSSDLNSVNSTTSASGKPSSTAQQFAAASTPQSSSTNSEVFINPAFLGTNFASIVTASPVKAVFPENPFYTTAPSTPSVVSLDSPAISASGTNHSFVGEPMMRNSNGLYEKPMPGTGNSSQPSHQGHAQNPVNPSKTVNVSEIDERFSRTDPSRHSTNSHLQESISNGSFDGDGEPLPKRNIQFSRKDPTRTAMIRSSSRTPPTSPSTPTTQTVPDRDNPFRPENQVDDDYESRFSTVGSPKLGQNPSLSTSNQANGTNPSTTTPTTMSTPKQRSFDVNKEKLKLALSGKGNQNPDYDEDYNEVSTQQHQPGQYQQQLPQNHEQPNRDALQKEPIIPSNEEQFPVHFKYRPLESIEEERTPEPGGRYSQMSDPNFGNHPNQGYSSPQNDSINRQNSVPRNTVKVITQLRDDEKQNRIIISRLLAELSYEKSKSARLKQTNQDYI